MGQCINNSFEGVCYYFNDVDTFEEGNIKGVSADYGFTIDKGYCVVEEDECPEDSCCFYETDFSEEDYEE